MDDLHAQINDLMNEKDELQDEVYQLENEVSRLKHENRGLVEALEQARDQSETAITRVRDLEHEVQDLQSQLRLY
jgi:chromosome segregation ATPase